jgi:hypothetical protein
MIGFRPTDPGAGSALINSAPAGIHSNVVFIGWLFKEYGVTVLLLGEKKGTTPTKMPDLNRRPRLLDASRLYFPVQPPGAIKMGGYIGGFWFNPSKTATR